MRRIATWLLSTLTIIVLLFGYHTSTSSVPATESVISSTKRTTDTAANLSGSASPSTSSKTFTGTSVNTRWGPVQVAITVAGSEITNVSVPVYPSGNSRDEEINSYALPILTSATIDAQSAKVDMVSGATVTSVGYLDSLQSALDKAGL